MKEMKKNLATSPKWHFLILGILLLGWSVLSQVRGVEYSLIKHKHIDTIVSIQSIGTILYSGKHYSITLRSVTVQFLGIPVKRIFWDNIAGVIIFESNEDTEKIAALFVPDFLDFPTVASMPTEQLRNSKWKNAISLTIPRAQRKELSELAHRCGKELIVR